MEAEIEQQPMPKSARTFLATLLVERHLFETIDEARRWIMAGNVLVNEQRIDKPGMLVPADAILRILGRQRYASRGGYKLEAALEYFHVDVTGRIALDSGASTGGFTDCLLQHGAALVYAVEVGYGQLIGRLRADVRVRNLERTNLSDELLTSLDPAPNLITLDLSYLSLTKALPIVAQLLASEGQVLALLKPLFEVESAEARRTGQVTDPVLLVEALHRVLDAGTSVGFIPRGAAKLALQPRHGVTEFMLYFERGTHLPSWLYDDALLRAIVDSPGIGSKEEEP
jgi:23S rRNA (cytidine1920-2'-O)/16S rRNA (cytidine1409-2'-O)-methyltransferase